MADPPPIIYWRVRGWDTEVAPVILKSLIGPTDGDVVKRRAIYNRVIPYGALAWARHPGGPWLPVAWMPWSIRSLLNDHGAGHSPDEETEA